MIFLMKFLSKLSVFFLAFQREFFVLQKMVLKEGFLLAGFDVVSLTRGLPIYTR